MSLATIANEAAVTRRTLYYHFADKDALVRVYLRNRDRSGRALFERAEAQNTDAASSVLAVFASLEAWFRTKEFRGCAFTNAIGEGRDTIVFAGPIARRHKRALRDWFVRICANGGAHDADALGEQLMICSTERCAARGRDATRRSLITPRSPHVHYSPRTAYCNLQLRARPITFQTVRYSTE